MIVAVCTAVLCCILASVGAGAQPTEPLIGVHPDTIQFGVLPVGASGLRAAAIGNVGAPGTMLVVDSVSVVGEGLSLRAAPPVPFTIGAGRDTTLIIEAAPLQPGQVDGQLIIESINAANSPFVVPIRLTGNFVPICDAGGPYASTPDSAVAFDATASRDSIGSITVYAWTFADGGSAQGPIVQHTFATTGVFSVTLTVTDDLGATRICASQADIRDYPISDPGGAYEGFVRRRISFDGRGSGSVAGSILAYTWSFGDGQTGSGTRAYHEYAGPEIYRVTLTITDDAGLTSSAGTTAAVELLPSDCDDGGFGPSLSIVGLTAHRPDGAPQGARALGRAEVAGDASGCTDFYEHPHLAGSLQLDWEIGDLLTAPPYAYVAADDIVVLDISNERAPVVIGIVPTPGCAQDLVLSGNHLLVMDEPHGLIIFDLSDPANPAEVDRFYTRWHPRSLAVVDSLACVAYGDDPGGGPCEGGVMIVSLPGRRRAELIAEVSTNGNAVGVAARGSYAYALDECTDENEYGETHLLTLDLTRPSAPVIVDQQHLSFGFRRLLVVGDHLYVGDRWGRSLLFDIREPRQPQEIDRLPFRVLDLVVRDREMLVAYDQLHWVDRTEPTQPVVTGALGLPLYAAHVEIVGDVAYVGGGSEIAIVDRIDSDPLMMLATVVIGRIYDLAIEGALLAVAAGTQGVAIIDIQDPLAPVLMEYVSTPTAAVGVDISDGYAYVTTSRNSATSQPSRLLVTDLDTRSIVAVVDDTGGFAVRARGDRAYTTGRGGLRVYDISTPTAPRVMGAFSQYPERWGGKIAIGAGVVHVADAREGRRIYTLDVSDPTRYPRLLDTYGVDAGILHLRLFGHLLYVAMTRELEIIDVSDPHDIYSVGSYLGEIGDVQILGDRLVQASSRSVSLYAGPDPSSPYVLGLGPASRMLRKHVVTDGDHLFVVEAIYVRAYPAPCPGEQYPPELSQFRLEVGDDGIRVLWEWSGNALGFNVWRTMFGSASPVRLNESLHLGNDYWDTTALLGRRYAYELEVVDPEGASRRVGRALGRIPFAERIELSVDHATSAGTGARLIWTSAHSVDHLEFFVERSSDGGNFLRLHTDPLRGAAPLAFEDADASPGADYQYRLAIRDPVTGAAYVDAPVSFTPVRRFWLSQISPNPLRGDVEGAVVSLSVPWAAPTRLRVCDVQGRVVRILADGVLQPGDYRFVWDGTHASGSPARSSVYFLELDSGDFKATRKITILR